MAYQAFYRKWRPKTFEEVYGQQFITKTLKNEIAGDKLSHAYLFCGSRGTGKTTCAKILAKAVNCEHPVDGNPCLACAACKSIETEAAMDVVEMDAASNTGVDDIRTLRENASYTPAACRYRVYIIDEVHMLSKSAFNALLKILEEPPAHVIFILATTDPEAIPVTVLSRCQRFDFKRLTQDEIRACLTTVCEKEQLTLSDAAASLIAHLADGGMRDALSLLDQCAGVSAHITEEIVADVTRSAGRGPIEELALALAKNQLPAALELLDSLHRDSKNLLHITRELLSLFRLAMLDQVDPSCTALRETLADERKTAAELGRILTQSDLFALLSELQDCYVRQCHADDQKLELEMSFIRLTDPRQKTDTQRLLSRLEKLEAALAAGGLPHEAAPAAPAPAIPKTAQPAPSFAPPATEQQTLAAEEKKAEAEPIKAMPKAAQATPEAAQATPEAAQTTPLEEPVPPGENDPAFIKAEFIEELGRTEPMLASMIRDVRFSCAKDRLTAQPGALLVAKELLEKEENRAKVEKAATACIGRPVHLILVAETAPKQPPSADRLKKCLSMARENGIPVEEQGRE